MPTPSDRTSGSPPLVSVIIPTFNRPEMLRRAIESVLAQTCRDYEIIVVNDNGIDVEGIICKLGGGGRIRYARHARNEGVSSSRNTGIRMAEGKYIAYLDDDDVYYPNHLEVLADFLERSGPACRIAYTDACRRTIRNVDGRLEVISRDVPYSSDFDRKRILRENFIPTLCLMQERKCLVDESLFDTGLKRTEDWDLWARLSRKWDFAHIREVTCEFSWHEDRDCSLTSGRLEAFQWSTVNMFHKNRAYVLDDPEARAQHKKFFHHTVMNIGKMIVESRQTAEDLFRTVFIGENTDLTIGKLRALSSHFVETIPDYIEVMPDVYQLICFLLRRESDTARANAYRVLASALRLTGMIYLPFRRNLRILVSDGQAALFRRVFGILSRKWSSK